MSKTKRLYDSSVDLSDNRINQLNRLPKGHPKRIFLQRDIMARAKIVHLKAYIKDNAGNVLAIPVV